LLIVLIVDVNRIDYSFVAVGRKLDQRSYNIFYPLYLTTFCIISLEYGP